MPSFYPKADEFRPSRSLAVRRLRAGLDEEEDDADESQPGVYEIWDPVELDDDEEAEPEAGDFWIDREDIEDARGPTGQRCRSRHVPASKSTCGGAS